MKQKTETPPKIRALILTHFFCSVVNMDHFDNAVFVAKKKWSGFDMVVITLSTLVSQKSDPKVRKKRIQEVGGHKFPRTHFKGK